MKTLNEMADEGVFELHIVHMETMTFSQQAEAAARSTLSLSFAFLFLPVYTRSKIFLRVHENGLTVSPSPFCLYFLLLMFPFPAYIHGCGILARNAGHKVRPQIQVCQKLIPHKM